MIGEGGGGSWPPTGANAGRGAPLERAVRPPGTVAQRAAREVKAALRPFTIPNGITLLRLALTPFFVLAVLSSDHTLALGLFIAAGISDALDGLLARVLGMRSRLGTYLDPIADKLLLVTAYVVLTLPIRGSVTIPLWLTVMALSRDFLIVLIALLLYLGAGVEEFPPSLWGKATTFIHVVTIALVLIANVTRLAEHVLLTCFYVALTLTIISGVDYIRRVAKTLEAIHDGQSR